ncbi:hypothetical protein SLS56_002674 [Neofusicoccum ribis]|uniref:Uncharacterized protein n=1 Tax=Neofusicoccum ribis TaxID=45134 RepID=A0ABR3T2M0_9PEZI
MRPTQKKRGLKSAAAPSMKSSNPESSTTPASTATKAKKRPRMLSGLHPSQDILDEVRPPWEMEEPASAVPPTSSRYTRGKKNGYKEGMYDMKFHPMDKTTRPKMAAKRERRLKALSTLVDSSEEENSEEEDSEDDDSHMTLSDGSGSDLEDSEQKDSEEEGLERRSGRQKPPHKPLYHLNKHQIDELDDSDDVIRPGKRRRTHQSIEHNPDSPPKLPTQKRKTRGSSGITLRHTSSRRTKGSEKQSVQAVSPPPMARFSEGLDIWKLPPFRRYFKHDYLSLYHKADRMYARQKSAAAVSSSDRAPQPMPGAYPASSSPMGNSQLENISIFPESPPASMKETMQRVEAVMMEIGMLIPQFPAIEAHLKKSLAVQVHEDTAKASNVANRAHARFPLAYPDDFEKENVRDLSRESSNATNDAIGNEEVMRNPSSGDVEDEGHQVHNVQQIGGQNRLHSSDLMPPPPLPSRRRPHSPLGNLPECSSGTELPEPLSSTLHQSFTGSLSSDHEQPPNFWRTIKLRLQDPPSTGGTPAQSEINDDSQLHGSSSADRGRTIKDTHLTVSQSEAIQSSQAEGPRLEDSQMEESQMEESQYPSPGLDYSSRWNSEESQHFNDAIYPR